MCCQGDDWTSHVVVDGKLITGQNPQVSTLPAVENAGLVPDMSMSLHCIGCCGPGHNALTGPQSLLQLHILHDPPGYLGAVHLAMHMRIGLGAYCKLELEDYLTLVCYLVAVEREGWRSDSGGLGGLRKRC